MGADILGIKEGSVSNCVDLGSMERFVVGQGHLLGT